MSQIEKQAPTGTQPAAYLRKTQSCSVQKPQQHSPTEAQRRNWPPETGRPDTRSPLDPWHSESYLIACLVRTHGWVQPGPGELRRFRRG